MASYILNHTLVYQTNVPNQKPFILIKLKSFMKWIIFLQGYGAKHNTYAGPNFNPKNSYVKTRTLPLNTKS